MSKLKNKVIRISNPFEVTSHNTEWTCAALLTGWINEIAKEKGIPIGTAKVERQEEGTRKRVDISIPTSPKSEKLLCVIECKIPQLDVYNYELKDDARKKADRRGAPYFGTCNFRQLVWWNTEKANNPTLTEIEQIINKYTLSEIYDLDLIEQSKYKEPIKKETSKFLLQLFNVFTGREVEPKQPIDEFLIYRLHEKIRVLSRIYSEIIYNEFHKDPKFAKALQVWFLEQGWNFYNQPQDFQKASWQTAYLLINKILFYDILQTKRPEKLDPLEIPKSLTKGAMLQKTLQNYFEMVLNIDYETIYSTDFIDTIAFPDEIAIVEEIKELIRFLNEYDFSKIEYDIIGRVFERLIPRNERHNLGQYFTNADVVDIILKFTILHEDYKVLDPACGAGTFLVRAYQHKKLKNQMKSHEDILKTVWGNDIAKFPAHLATINLAIRDLGVDKNYPNILKEDFFALNIGADGFDNEQWRKRRAETLDVEEREVTYPRWFDAIVGNPPYTRQEEIPEIGIDKEKLIKNALLENNKPIANISKRAGIYAYFFVHASKFLKDGKHLGFVVSNSWLDVDYGKGLQEFFLMHFKIIAIIGSKVERWFTEADINTCIVILQKCSDEKLRNENSVRFVTLKKKLSEFIPHTSDTWEKQIERIQKIELFRRTILYHDSLYENEEMRIFPIKQEELWIEGFKWKDNIEETDSNGIIHENAEKFGKYVGGKWGKYLRAPEIFFKVLDKGKGKLAPLRKVARINAGCYTGINEFFYIEKNPNLKEGIEEEFLTPIIRNTRQINSIAINTKAIDTHVFVCQWDKNKLKKQRNDGALAYINWGERQTTRERQKRKEGVRYPNVETVKSNKPGWWSIPERNITPTELFMIYVINKRFIVALADKPITSDRCFHRISPNIKEHKELLGAILNSTLTIFNIEVYGRSNLGLGALKFETSDAKRILTLNPNVISEKKKNKILLAFSSFKSRTVKDIFKEIGASSPENVTLENVEPCRRELDKVIMGNVLGLTDEEQLEVYKAVVDLVRSRLEKAKSAEKQKKLQDGIDTEAFVKNVLNKIGDETIGKFYKENITSLRKLVIRNLIPRRGKVELVQDLYGWQVQSGGKGIICKVEDEAKYLKIFVEMGFEEIEMPLEKAELQKVLPDLISIKDSHNTVMKVYLNSIVNKKLRTSLENKIWRELMEM